MCPRWPAAPEAPRRIAPFTKAAPPTPVPKVSRTALLLPTGGTPENFCNQSRTGIVVGVERQVTSVDHVCQKAPFEKVQISGQAVYARSRSVDNALTTNANSANLRRSLLQDKVYKIMQGCGRSWRWLLKARDQIPAEVHDRSFDSSGTDVYANHEDLVRRSVCRAWAHNRCALYALYAILVSHPGGELRTSVGPSVKGVKGTCG